MLEFDEIGLWNICEDCCGITSEKWLKPPSMIVAVRMGKKE